MGKAGFYFFLLHALWLTIFTSCNEEDFSDTLVVTEDVIYVSAEKVRVTGRVLSIGKPIDDHGFFIAGDETFSSPVIVSLGPKSTPGRFIGETSDLVLQSDYVFKSFVYSGGETIFGSVKSFQTLSPAIVDFSPKTGTKGQKIIIRGSNLTHDTKVFFGENEAEVIEIRFESELTVKLPEIGDSFKVPVKLVVQGQTIQSPHMFEYIFGSWQSEGFFINDLQLAETMYFMDGDQFIFGLGRDTHFQLNEKIWKLDLTSWTWSELSYPGPPTRSPFFSNGFWGTGASIVRGNTFTLNNAFWKYSSGEFQQKTNLPFQMYKSVSFEIDGVLYVAGGYHTDAIPATTIYKYNETSDQWTIQGELPFGLNIISDYPHFVFENIPYFITEDQHVRRYDTAADTWDIISEFPSDVNISGISVVLGDKIYIGLFENSPKIWEFDLKANIWKSKSSFTGISRDYNAGFFTYDNKVYVLRSTSFGQFFEDPRMELWSFVPNALK